MHYNDPLFRRKAKAIAIAKQKSTLDPAFIRWALVFLFIILLSTSAFAQVSIFEEDFSSVPNGTTSSSNWGSDASACTLSNGSDYFEVKSSRFEGRDMDGEGIWYTDVLDISSYTDVEIEVDLQEAGNMESSDYMKVYYKLDGGTETFFSINGNNTNDFNNIIASQSGLNGSTLQVIIKVKNNDGSEKHRIHSVSISGTEAVSSLTLSTSVTDVSCNSGDDGSIDLTVSDGSGSSGGSGGGTSGSSGCSDGVASPNTCSSCTSIAPTSGTLNVNSGQTICIPSGQTFSGFINMNGGTLVICGNIIPWSFNFNSGTIINNSTLALTSLSINSNCRLENYGTVQVSGSVNVNHEMENHGALMVSGNLSINSSASFVNTNYVAISSTVTNNNDLDNLGIMNIAGGLTINSNATLNNECTININGPVTVNDSLVNNGSVNGSGSSTINSNGVLSLGPNAYFSASSLTLNGDITGNGPSCASVEISGNTTINGSGSVSNNVDYCDANGIETNWGSISGTTDCSCNATGVAPTGSSGSYTYIWSNGATTEDISDLTAGTYTVTVTSSGGATATTSVNVGTPSALSASVSTTNATVGQNDGNLDLTVSGGTSPFSFSWSNGATSEDITGLAPGTYTVTVTDDNGCTTTASDVISYGNVSGCICVQSGNWSVDAQWMGNCHGGGGQYPNYLDTAIINGHVVTVNSNETAAQVSLGSTASDSSSLTIKDNGILLVGYNVLMTNEHSSVMLLSLTDQGSMTVGGDIVLDVANANTTTLWIADNAVLKLNGDIERNSRPAQYGKLLMSDNGSFELVGTGHQTIAESFGNGDDSFNYKNLKINNTSASAPQLSLGGDITVTGTLTLTDGIVSTGSDIVKVTNTSASSVSGGNDTSFIAGNLRRYIATNTSEYLFPIGKADASSYDWFKLKNGELVNVEYITASFGDVNSDDLLSEITIGLLTIPLVPMFDEGMWTIEPDMQPTGGYYTAYVSTANFQGLADNSFELVKRSSGGGVLDWALQGGVLPLANAQGTRVSDGFTLLEGLTSFSEFGIRETEGGTGLPVELTNFGANAKDQKVYLDWATAVEINNELFTVERSQDAVNFVEVTSVPGAGNSSVVNTYSAIDYDPFLGTSFYRLKQTDFNGDFKFSDMLSVTVMSAIKTDLNIYPNPNQGSFRVEITTPLEEVELQIMNNFGQLVHVEHIIDVTGKAVVDLNLSGELPSGIYFVKLDLGSDTFIKQMMVE